MGATLFSYPSVISMVSFNPRARDGRDRHVGKSCIIPERVSIHAPVMGATFDLTHTATSTTCFNPRARDGRDEGVEDAGARFVVSIHAPVMGATVASTLAAELGTVSIHAPVMGATSNSSPRALQDAQFQSTRP